MTYDQYKTEAPPVGCKCEICDEYTDDFETVIPHGQKWGYILCPDCAKEMRTQMQESDLAEWIEFNS